MMFFDPVYLIIVVPGMILAWWAQSRVKGAYKKYLKVPSAAGRTGAEVAESILASKGLTNVKVRRVAGELSDHYNPGTKTVALSEAIYRGRSLASLAIAAHECGHAIQHARRYVPLEFRTALFPVASIGSTGLNSVMLMGGFILASLGYTIGSWLFLAGIFLFGFGVLFHIVTLPVEFNASSRAMAILSAGTYLSPREVGGAKKVLDAAALTYVAGALIALLQLFYFVMRFMGGSRS